MTTAQTDKAGRYAALMPGLRELLRAESAFVPAVGNLLAALKEEMKWLWIGLYRVAPGNGNDREVLLLDLFQGPVACTRIGYGKGVCGTSWASGETVVVPDVHAFPGHIACSTLSRSEIVIPVIRNNQVAMVLDVDSDQADAFDETDRRYLEEVATLISDRL